MRPADAELLERSNERDRYLRRIRAAWRDGWRHGYRAGYEAGRRDEAAERDQAWVRFSTPIARGAPSFAEVERRRWMLRGEPRTRETFGNPHPADYTAQRQEGAA